MALPNIRVYIGRASSFVVGGTAVLGSTKLGALASSPPGTPFILGPPAGAQYELTPFAQSVSIRRGRTRVTDSFDAGSATVRIFDQTGIFSPDNSQSPLYVSGASYALPLRQFRITATLNGTEYDLFNGYTSSYDYEYEPGVTASYVTIVATDAFRLLNLATIASVTGATTGESSGARVVKILTQIGVPNGLQSVETGNTTLSADVAANRSALAAIQQIESTELGAFFVDATGLMTFLARQTLQQYASGATATPLVFNEVTVSRTNLVSNPSFESNTTDWASAQSSAVRSLTADFSGVASLAVTMSSTSDSNVAYVTVTAATAGNHTFSMYVWVPSTSTLAGRSVSVDREAGTATSSSVSQSNGTIVADSWVRFSVTRNVTVPGTLQMVVRLSGTLSTAVGQIVYLDAAMFEQASSAGLYIEGTVAPEIPFTGIRQGFDDENVFNDITVEPASGSVDKQTASDATSKDLYFTRSLSKTGTLIQTTSEAADHAAFLLNFRKNPTLLIDAIDVVPLTLTSAQAISVSTVELCRPITVTKNYGSGTYVSRTLTVQGVTHDITPGDWQMSLSTAEPVSGDGFILDSSTYGILDVNTLSF